MAMSKQEFLDLCAIYALGALDGEDLVRFREALDGADAEMRAALAEALQSADQLSLSAPAEQPSSRVKERLMRRVRTDAARETKAETAPAAEASIPWTERLAALFARPPRRFGVAAFASLILAVGAITYALLLSGEMQRGETALADARDRIVALEDSLSQQEALLEVIRSREMQLVALSGMESVPAGYGKIMWDPERKIAVLQVQLPPEPDGMDYQLWVIRDQKPMDAGVFQVASGNAGSGGLYRIEQLVETDKRVINAFAVTVEPKGGMPQPTGEMVLMGAVEI